MHLFRGLVPHPNPKEKSQKPLRVCCFFEKKASKPSNAVLMLQCCKTTVLLQWYGTTLLNCFSAIFQRSLTNFFHTFYYRCRFWQFWPSPLSFLIQLPALERGGLVNVQREAWSPRGGWVQIESSIVHLRRRFHLNIPETSRLFTGITDSIDIRYTK